MVVKRLKVKIVEEEVFFTQITQQKMAGSPSATSIQHSQHTHTQQHDDSSHHVVTCHSVPPAPAYSVCSHKGTIENDVMV
eukprot:scaffold380980_cov76-Cyclotella_meneghiniana.AAC.2